MRRFASALTLAAAALLPACAPAHNTAVRSAAAVDGVRVEQRQPVTVLVSIDGFHPDYLDRGLTPTLSSLAEAGVRAPMRPSFPSKTFPNHWTLVTGEVPDVHGITANRIEDPARPDEVFTMATVDPWWWKAAKPIWVEAEEAGIRTASMFWPGSAVAWGGTMPESGWGAPEGGRYPQDWQQFSMAVTNVQRVNSVLDWLRRPAEIRPAFVTLYFDTIDTAGHGGGPDSAELNQALIKIDGDIAMLVAGLERLQQPANLVIVSDHGMAATSSARVIALDEVLDPSLYRLVEGGAYATFRPTEGNVDAFEAALLKEHPHMECWRKGEMPARFAYGTNVRIPPYFCLPQTGWTIAPSRNESEWTGGNHGYDPAAPEMTALFIANGPAFRQGATIPGFTNTAIAPLLRQLMGLPQDDTTLSPVRGALADRKPR
ncbi:ectonucleotide pyrophosphatase/phosphodiesterase [Pelagerythrobacter marensis]|uniref:Phosphodiesterase-nucleotide pyrophosphatase n=1 Tax=Pelagerythrobacter marensis TaxID=543877 RepID=A0A0G3X8J0_9SPHN|nr:ectonucleotide pyrophosphatase/phosphodiesterase [Pelagerythrobacter marensis]AKM06934.1 Phosphodiesterase-nucleotide pyrophosphatase [Pelagerythrobacter marensis]